MDLDYNKRLLILIDDDNIFTTVLKTTLSKLPLSHVEVLVFENGKTAFEFITENENGIAALNCTLFLDLNMPEMNGWEFLEQMVKIQVTHKPNFEIYILSSSMDNRDQKRALVYPFLKSFISKPISKDLLIQVLSNQSV